MNTDWHSVVALDPGERTGIAWCDVREGRVQKIGHKVLPLQETAFWLFEAQKKPRSFDTVVYETWYPRPDAKGSMDWIRGDHLLSAQLVGMIRFTAWLSRAKLVSYDPVQKKVGQASMTKPFLDAQAECDEQHDKDALMHLSLYCFENWEVR